MTNLSELKHSVGQPLLLGFFSHLLRNSESHSTVRLVYMGLVKAKAVNTKAIVSSLGCKALSKKSNN